MAAEMTGAFMIMCGAAAAIPSLGSIDYFVSAARGTSLLARVAGSLHGVT